MKRIASIVALAAWALGLGACVIATAPPQPEPGPATSSQTQPPAVDTAPPIPVKPGDLSSSPAHHACRLQAAKKSDDACKIDADCAPSDPCHAAACVAKAKSKPRTPDTMCTMMMACETADANRCGCLEGRCALIPPDDAAKE
jgi:hypothetical protein